MGAETASLIIEAASRPADEGGVQGGWFCAEKKIEECIEGIFYEYEAERRARRSQEIKKETAAEEEKQRQERLALIVLIYIS